MNNIVGTVFAAKNNNHLIPSIIMEHPDLKNLKYGTIYIFSDPKSMALLHGSSDFLRKIVYPMDIEWIDDPGREGALLVARRFNVGNIGQYATVSLRTSEYNRGGGQMHALHRFTDALMGLSDPDSGDIVIDEDDFRPWAEFHLDSDIRHRMQMSVEEPCMPKAAPQDKTRVESVSKRIAKKASRWLKGSGSQTKGVVNRSEAPEEVDLLQEEAVEIRQLERERKAALERIRHEIINYVAKYHDDPQDLMEELLRGKVIVGQPGRVLVNGDMKIVMPEYDEMEIEMPAMCRTLYILFLKQRKLGVDGIVLKNIDEYRDEILDIYGLVKPGANERRVMRTVDNLCDPLSESLNQTISRINRCIRNVITDKELAKDYCITGERGQEYGILLDPQYLELPYAVTGA